MLGWGRIVSVDGDADRLVYFSLLDNQVTLFDGDKIATLMASYVCKLLKTLPPGQIRDASVGPLLLLLTRLKPRACSWFPDAFVERAGRSQRGPEMQNIVRTRQSKSGSW